MTDKEMMRLELKENGVQDNPFDVMLYHALELTRDLLFACRRLNPEMLKRFCANNVNSCMDRIKEEFSKLVNMSEETVTMCRETSHYYQQDDFNKMNETLLEFEKSMETVYSKCVPCRNDRYEQARLGVESDEYKRLLELRNIITESEELSSVSDEYLISLCDVISRPDKCLKYYWMTQEELEERQEVINKYNLSEHDIEYMISYRSHKK